MTKKTGSKTLKARQLMKTAKVWKQIRKMREAGIELEAPKPSEEVVKEKEEEFEKLYLELTSGTKTEQKEKEETSSKREEVQKE